MKKGSHCFVEVEVREEGLLLRMDFKPRKEKKILIIDR
jgi:hypothetical protein